jgi:HSP20 family protein
MDPFGQMDNMIDRAFNRAFGRGLITPAGTSWTPGTTGMDLMPTGMTSDLMFTPLSGTHPMDIVEKDDHYAIYADCPGMCPEDINVECNQGVLTMRGEHKEAKEMKDKKGRVHRSERVTRSFTRSFALPKNCNEDDIKACLDKGVLCVCVAKTPEPDMPKPKRITIGTEPLEKMGHVGITGKSGTGTGTTGHMGAGGTTEQGGMMGQTGTKGM